MESKIVLEIFGVGYRAQVSGNKLVLSLGYSNPVEYSLPDGITASVDQKQTQITLTGIDKQQIGHVAACIKALRPPDAHDLRCHQRREQALPGLLLCQQ